MAYIYQCLRIHRVSLSRSGIYFSQSKCDTFWPGDDPSYRQQNERQILYIYVYVFACVWWGGCGGGECGGEVGGRWGGGRGLNTLQHVCVTVTYVCECVRMKSNSEIIMFALCDK